MSVSTFIKTLAASAKAHKPEIIVGLGLAAGAGAIFVAVKETPACLDAFEKADDEKILIIQDAETGEQTETHPGLDWKEKAVIFAKSYWKAGFLEAASIFLICYGSKIRLDSYTAMVTLYGLTKAERDDLKKIIDAHPDNWKKKFQEKAAEVHLDESNPEDIPKPRMSNAEVPMPLPLFWDDQAKVYFRLTEEDLRDAVADFTHKVTTDPFQCTTINDWMSLIGHEPLVNGDYIIMTADDEYSVGALKYQQIGVKEAPNSEPARMMRFTWQYHTDIRAISNIEYSNI